MKNKILQSFTLILFFCSNIHSQSILDSLFNCNIKNASLEEFVAEIESQADVHFFFAMHQHLDCSISVEKYNTPLWEILIAALYSTPYTYCQTSKHNIGIIPKKSKIVELPQYPSTTSKTESKQEDEEDRYLNGRRSDIKETITIGSEKSFARKVTIKGLIKDNETQDPLIGATLYLTESETGVISDTNGNIVLNIAPGKYNAEIRSLGMKTKKCFFTINSGGNFEVGLQHSNQMLQEVTISGEQNYGNRTGNMGEDKLVMKKVKKMPSLTGNVDIVSISKMLPGIVSVSEGTGSLNVRGGGADQNIFYLNNIPIYNTSHAFGFFPAINSTIIDEFSIYKSFIPIHFGGRLSSIFDISTRAGNKKDFRAQGSLGLITTDFTIEGPIVSDKLSFIASGRASYSDWILNKIDEPAIKNSDMSFYDASALLDYKINNNNSVEILAYKSYDDFKNAGVNEYSYSNFGIGATYKHHFGSKLNSELNISHSKYGFDNSDIQFESSSFTQNYGIQHSEARGILNYLYNEKNVFQTGFSSTLLELDRGNLLPYNDKSLYTPLKLGKEKGMENVLFIHDSYKITSQFTLKAGLRFSHFTQFGPKTVYKYKAGTERLNTNIVDSLSFDKNDAVKHYSGPELRLAADYNLSSINSIKLSFSQMRQYMFLLSNTYAATPVDQWKLADYHLKPSKQWQVSAGYYHDLPSWKSSFVIEGYYKKANNIVELKDGADLITTPNLETATLQGDQESYGLELLISKNKGVFTGWTSYTYSRSLIQVDGGAYWNKINSGRQYASNFDRPHVLNAVANLQVSRRINLASNLVYSTGRPITLPMSNYTYFNIEHVDYSDRNAYRVPNYFRMDFSVILEGNLKAQKPLHSKWIFSVYNLTGRKNPYSVYFKNQGGKIQGYQYSIIGVPVFSISWSYKFGNYLTN